MILIILPVETLVSSGFDAEQGTAPDASFASAPFARVSADVVRESIIYKEVNMRFILGDFDDP